MALILFCNVAYMQYYDFDLIKETPKHGGQYVADTGDAFEKHNFHICEDGQIRGFVETKYRDSYSSGKQPNQIRIENIDAHYKNADKIDGVTVIFCAHSDTLKKSVIIGWYKNATVYRKRPEYNGRQYNIECSSENAFLLDEDSRTFVVPRAAQDGFGFGQANVWYAKEEQASAFVASVFKYIEDDDTSSLSAPETIPQVIPEEYKESGIGKKVLVNKYERNPIARRKCLELQGTNCKVCGFNSSKVYGVNFENKIEVHHIKPINEIQGDYKVDPEHDLIPVCPNCHMMLHTKMSNGEFPTISTLQKHVKDGILRTLIQSDIDNE